MTTRLVLIWQWRNHWFAYCPCLNMTSAASTRELLLQNIDKFPEEVAYRQQVGLEMPEPVKVMEITWIDMPC